MLKGQWKKKYEEEALMNSFLRNEIDILSHDYAEALNDLSEKDDLIQDLRETLNKRLQLLLKSHKKV